MPRDLELEPLPITGHRIDNEPVSFGRFFKTQIPKLTPVSYWVYAKHGLLYVYTKLLSTIIFTIEFLPAIFALNLFVEPSVGSVSIASE